MRADVTASASGVRSTVGAGSRFAVLVAACGFVAFYLLTDVVTSVFADAGLPLPTASAGVVRDWFVDNRLAAVVMAACQAVSVVFLAGVAIALRVRRARPWGLAAAALMIVSCVCAWTLAAVAPGASLGVVDVLRTASFIAGGTAHVLALGLFVFLGSRAGGFGRGLRVLAVVALVVGVLSLSSLVVFQGAVFILVGRLVCMVWTIGAGVSLARRGGGGTR